jgi:hypothetical protein
MSIWVRAMAELVRIHDAAWSQFDRDALAVAGDVDRVGLRAALLEAVVQEGFLEVG